ncbi:MAG: ComF family protein [Alphaproteobacteria bacterium]
MKAKIKEIAHIALDTILPPRCVVSGDMVDRQGMVAPHVWAAMDFIHDPMCVKCGVPFDYAASGMAEIAGFEGDEGLECMQCLDYPPPFASARAALRYNDESRDLILGFKHGDQTHAALAFVPWLMNAGREMLGQADVIVPVPLHRWRLLQRRYNQAAIMAHYVSKESGVPHVCDFLVRKRATATQGHLSFDERRKNVRKAFEVNGKYVDDVKGRSIILIDDVYTTGATVKECAKALKRAGAGEVHVLTLARVVKDELVG